ncbi:MAG: thioredoxin family protein [Acidiferrobacterales bacterium]|jgi:putative thioredoxin|nr:thioredoxin family protein [Acidiferrobacterales bacterium]
MSSDMAEQAENSDRIFNVNLDDFESRVIEVSSHHPVLVDFWADWCPPCIAIAPIMEKAVNAWESEIELAKLEVDEGDNMKIAGRYQVRGFPTIIAFINGEEHGRFSGAKSLSFVEQFIADAIASTG